MSVQARSKSKRGREMPATDTTDKLDLVLAKMDELKQQQGKKLTSILQKLESLENSQKQSAQDVEELKNGYSQLEEQVNEVKSDKGQMASCDKIAALKGKLMILKTALKEIMLFYGV